MRTSSIVLCTLLICYCLYAQAQRGIVHMEAPTYPNVAQWAQIQGKATLSVMIGTDGKVLSVSVKAIQGKPLFGDEAAKNIKTWIFTPAPGETTQEVVYDYRLIEKAIFPCSYVVLESPQHVVIQSTVPYPDTKSR